jgi:hypothetical protein
LEMVNSARAGSFGALTLLRLAWAIKGDENSPAAPNAAAPRMKSRLHNWHMSIPPESRHAAGRFL